MSHLLLTGDRIFKGRSVAPCAALFHSVLLCSALFHSAAGGELISSHLTSSAGAGWPWDAWCRSGEQLQPDRRKDNILWAQVSKLLSIWFSFRFSVRGDVAGVVGVCNSELLGRERKRERGGKYVVSFF